MDQGLNPIEVEREEARARERAKVEERRRETVRELADEFMARYVDVERRRPDHVRQMLYGSDKHGLGILNDIGDLKAKDITRRDIVKALDKIVNRGARVLANRTGSVLKQMFQYGVERGVLERNPCADIRRRTIGGSEKPSERTLTAEEIETLWLKIDSARTLKRGERPWLHRSTALAMMLLLATGQRKGELLRARWEHLELDSDAPLWMIPSEHSKNGRAHDVPLAPLPVSLFRELKALAGKSAFVLPSPNDKTHVTERAISRAAARAQTYVGIPKWVPHDLRRTAASQLAELGVEPHVIEKILNHTMQGVMAVYNRYDYLAERRQALEHWSTRLAAIVAQDGEV